MHARPQVRLATPADKDTIRDFNVRLADESEGKTLDAALVDAGVAALLADPAKGRYYLAEHNGQIVGQLAITFEWSDWRNGWFWWLQSVYVRSDARKAGVFRALLAHVLEEADREANVVGVRLYVEHENRPAHAVYQRLGFVWTDYKVMERLGG